MHGLRTETSLRKFGRRQHVASALLAALLVSPQIHVTTHHSGLQEQLDALYDEPVVEELQVEPDRLVA